MLPLTAGFLLSGPVSRYLSDRFGSRPFAVCGMLMAASSFGLMELLPINFSYKWFAVLLLANELAMGLFASPNRAAVMNSLPPDQRGHGSGMGATTMNAAMVLSMRIFFTLIIVGIAGYLPSALYNGLTAHGVPAAAARSVAAHVVGLRGLPGLQPHQEPARTERRTGPSAPRPNDLPHRPVLLSEPHHRALQARPARGPRLRGLLLPAGGRRGRGDGQAVFLQGSLASHGRWRCAHATNDNGGGPGGNGTARSRRLRRRRRSFGRRESLRHLVHDFALRHHDPLRRRHPGGT
jgi:MFS family permease